MKTPLVRYLAPEDEPAFLAAMQRSKQFHHPWTRAPLTTDEFSDYLYRSQQPNQKSYLIHDENENIIGIINLSEIIYGLFQSAYLGYYVVVDYAHQGYIPNADQDATLRRPFCCHLVTFFPRKPGKIEQLFCLVVSVRTPQSTHKLGTQTV